SVVHDAVDVADGRLKVREPKDLVDVLACQTDVGFEWLLISGDAALREALARRRNNILAALLKQLLRCLAFRRLICVDDSWPVSTTESAVLRANRRRLDLVEAVSEKVFMCLLRDRLEVFRHVPKLLRQ